MSKPRCVETILILGLVVNGLVSNAPKYVFPNGRKGIIGVALSEKDEQLILRVYDDGIGIQNQ
jgi:two-component sensor histidine kinase